METVFVFKFIKFIRVFIACCVLSLVCNAYFALRGESLISKFMKLAATPPIFYNFHNITVPPKGYLVFNENCRIQRVETFPDYILNQFKPLQKYVCSKNKPMVRKTYDNNLQQYRLHIDETRYKAGLHNCYFEEITQHPVYRNWYNKTKYTEFQNNFLVPKHIKFGLIVQCFLRPLKTPMYLDAFFFFQTENEVNATKQPINDTKPLGIILIGIDSVSQFNFRRTMPRTFDFFKRNIWFELSGYNKVGRNTLPNLMAIMAGYDEKASNKHCRLADRGYLDNCHLLFEKFRSYEFRTAYAEDQAKISSFVYSVGGFRSPPTEFYMLPLMRHFEYAAKSKSVFCIGERVTANVIYDAATDFMSALSEQAKFGFFWTNSFSHDHYDTPSSYDEHMLDYMHKWQRHGFFENNVFIFLSDHGMRYGPLQRHPDGFYEQRLPVVFIWLPPHIRFAYPQFVYALTVNKNRLTSPYDIHMTLQQLMSISRTLNGFNATPIAPAESCATCQSVLKPVKENRSCAEAGLSLHWCACQKYIPADKGLFIQTDIMDLILSKMNEYLRRNAYGLCRKITLERIDAVDIKANVHRLKKDKSQLYDFKSVDPKNEGIAWRVSFVTKPKHLKYETTFIYFQKSHEINLDMTDISLLDKYENMSWCVRKTLLKQFCFCR